jgi:hypothetical protein
VLCVFALKVFGLQKGQKSFNSMRRSLHVIA